jgi:hypothetical protein
VTVRLSAAARRQVAKWAREMAARAEPGPGLVAAAGKWSEVEQEARRAPSELALELEQPVPERVLRVWAQLGAARQKPAEC